MKKVKSKVKVIAITSALAIGTAAFGNSYMTNAEQKIKSSDSSIQLNVEKMDSDTVKIYLSNFTDLAKSLQLSLKIDEGNVKFVDNQIKWLSNEDEDSEKVKKHYKIDKNKKEIDFFILSDKPINSDGGIVEICEIDVSKDESIAKKLFKSSGDGSYKIVPNEDNDEAYSYVTYSTNKRVGGSNIVNASDDKLTINTNPVISFKDSPAVVGDKIIIEKGTVFNIKDYVIAHDANGNEIKNIEYTGKVENKKAGSYEIECKVTDSFGDKTTMKITVIVQEAAGNLAAPTLSIPQDPVVISVGDSFDPLDGVSAKDYQGRDIKVKVDKNYDTETEGTYTLTYTATDYRGITASGTRTLIVKEVINSDDIPGNGGDTPEDGGNTPDDGGNIAPDGFKDILDGVNVVNGKGTITSPYLVDVNNLSSEQFAGFTNKLSRFAIEIEKVRFDYNENYKIADLKLTNKASAANLFRNSNNMYLSIRVKMSNKELLNDLNKFIVQYGGNPDEVEKPGNSGESSGSGESSEGNGSNGSNSGISDGTNGDSNSQAGNSQGNISNNPGNNSGSSHGGEINNLPNSGAGTVNNNGNISNENLSDSAQAIGGNAGHGVEKSDGQSLESTADVSEKNESASTDSAENSDVQSEHNKDMEKEEVSNGDKIEDKAENKPTFWKKIGIVAGILVGLAAIGASVFYFIKKKKSKH